MTRPSTIATRLAAALADAHNQPDDLRPEVAAQRRQDATERAVQQARADLANAQRSAPTLVDTLRHLERALDSGDAATLIRREHRWRRAEALLNAGKTLGEVLDGADGQTVLAIAEWAPSRLQAHEGMTLEDAHRTTLHHVAPRLADTGNADAAAAARSLAQAEATQRWAEVIEGVIQGGGRSILTAVAAGALKDVDPEGYAEWEGAR